MELGGRIDISMVFLCIVKILSLLLTIPHNSYFVHVNTFGFVDPTNILRSCHLTPDFSKSKLHPDC